MISALGRPQRAPWLIPIALVCPLGLVAASVAAGHVDERTFVSFVALASAMATVYLAWHAEPAWVISVGIAATVFSARWDEMGFPIGIDRILISTAVLAVLCRAATSRLRPSFRLGAAHWALLAAMLWIIGSAIAAGTALEGKALFGLLDRIGLVPFLLFLVAPFAFRTERQRRILLGTLVGLGGYLGLTALFEMLALDQLVFPRYILDPTVGLHDDRARGPFAAAVPNGLALYACGVAAVIGALAWRGWARAVAVVVAGLCAAGSLFTLTRSIWLSVVVATVATLVVTPGLRRFLLPTLITGGLLVITLLAVVPNLEEKATLRRENQLTVWDRRNLNTAMINMIEARPLLGFGWATFERKSPPFFRQADYPLQGVGDAGHNTFLVTSAELGLIGAGLWILALILAVGGAIFARGPPELRMWRIGLVALFVQYFVVANFVVLVYTFPNALLWTWAGVATAWVSREHAI